MPEKQNGQIVSFFKKIAEMFSGSKKQEKPEKEAEKKIEETKSETSIIPAVPIKQLEKKVKQRWLPAETKKAKNKTKTKQKKQTQDLLKKIGKISTKATKALQKKIELEKKKILPESSEAEIKKAQRKIKRLEKKLLRKEAAKKGARKRKKKQEEIMERLGAIESKVEPLKPLAEADKSLFVGEKTSQTKATVETKEKKWLFSKVPSKEKTEEKQLTTIQQEKKTKGINIEFGKPEKGKKDYSIMQAQQTTEETQSTANESTEPAAVSSAIVEENAQSLPEEIVLGEEKKQEEKELSIDDQIELTKRMISRTRYEFFKRMISEEEFKRRTSSLEEKLHLLQEKKKLLAEKKSQEQTLAQATNAPAKKAFFSIGASTKNNTVPVAQPAERKGIPLFFGTEKASDVSQTITQNNAGVDPKILESMEAKLQEISEKYNISEKAMVSNLKKFGTDRIIEDFDKLIRLIETEHEEKKKAAEEKKEEKMRFDSVSKDLAEKKKEKDKGIQKEVQVEKLETDFDRIENFVNENGRVKAGQVARALNINPKLVEECARILEQNGLVKIEYPPVGDVNIIAAGYIPKAEKKAEKPKGIKLPKLNIFNRQKK